MTKISKSLVYLGENLWAYPSRSGKSLEFFVRGRSSSAPKTTHTFRISFKLLRQIEKKVRGRI